MSKGAPVMLETFWEEGTAVPVSCLGCGTDGWEVSWGVRTGWVKCSRMVRGDQR